jgi:NAD+ synthase
LFIFVSFKNTKFSEMIHTEKVVPHIVKWLADYAKKAGVQGFVVGVSGGIDSAVTSTLCAETGLKTLCVEMPIHQEKSQVNRAQEHIAQLKEKYANVSATRVDLTNTFDLFQEAFSENAIDTVKNLALANTRARLRMTSLYYLAGLHSCLVAGTGNKVEDFGVGFYTKYGDGGVDLSPIADLVKSEVFQIGAYLGVPSAIQSAAPTDGLFGDSRTDEDQLGASYDELEIAMQQKDQGISLEALQGREKKVFEIFLKLNRANQHKMNPIPVCQIPEEFKK